MKYLFSVTLILFLGLGLKTVSAGERLKVADECIYIFPSGEPSVDLALESNFSFLGFRCFKDDPYKVRVILIAGKPEPVMKAGINKFYIILPISIYLNRRKFSNRRRWMVWKI